MSDPIFIEAKPWFYSKTIWFNIGTAFVAVGNEMMPLLEVADSSEDLRAFLLVALAVGNTILRIVTRQPLSKR
ncbi:MAG TPA: hypothetical protein VJ884_01315 [Salinibacter sp.]|nr:hypothetical protein [Salinibacter sp.]